MSKTPIIVVDSGELYVFGKLISRHPELPWLFSITDVYKACEKAIKIDAKKYGKDVEKTYKSKRPGAWLQWNTKDERINNIASKLRKRINKYGIDCGFGQRKESTASCLAVLSSRDLCVKSVQGNTKLRGTYVAQDLIILYAGFLNNKLQSSVIDTFISVLNGYSDEVIKKVEKNERIAKGTKTRSDNIQLNNRLVEACGMKNVLPMKVQEGINEGVLGMTATKYKLAFDVKEPFNDNLTEAQLDMKNAGISLATYNIRTHKKPTLTHKEGRQLGKNSGIHATLIMTNPEVKTLLDTLTLKLNSTKEK